VQSIPLLIYISKQDNTFELFILSGEDGSNMFRNLLAKFNQGKSRQIFGEIARSAPQL
jgi:hypothetical protein